MTRASDWQHLYNSKPDDSDRILSNMAEYIVDSTVMVWEGTHIEMFLFKDNSVLVIPEAESARVVVWGGE